MERTPSTLIEAADFLLEETTGLTLTGDHGAGTARRFVAMLDELTRCRNCDGSCIKWKDFPSGSVRDMVVVKQIPFWSVCNHHVITFSGYAHIGYVPDRRIAGLSKFARVVHHFARRLQVQERLAEEIADFLQEKLSPQGLAIVLEAEHMCMTVRGVQVPGTKTTTARMTGCFADHSKSAKQEFLTYITGGA